MKFTAVTIIVAYFGISNAAPAPRNMFTPSIMPPRSLRGREVPQEHSHNQFLATVRISLNTKNPNDIDDPVFGLLGNAAAAGGAGKITNLDCLQQSTADQAFTNAKAASDVDGMTAALIYRALERNTGSVSLASMACNETAVNPEINAISQHQDPASTGAAATNKAIVLELAKQIASVGGDPQDALKSGTFAPGTIGDPTAAGNTCDIEDDTLGCIFTQNLLVEDATADEVTAAAGVSASTAVASASSNTAAAAIAAASDTSACPAAHPITATTNTVIAAATTTTTSAAAANNASDTSGTNVQTFTGDLGRLPPPVIFTEGAARPFAVDGTTDINKAAALQRSCSVQHNACADAANNGSLTSREAQCETQETQCNAAASISKRATLDFGSCSNPTIIFADRLDGRDQASFEPANETEFNHGSALNIGVIASFICGQLSSSCNASSAAISACSSAAAAAASSTGQAAAGAFNAALGISTFSSEVAAVSTTAAVAAFASTAAAVADVCSA